ncbi:DUF3040 domain-containing protein [Pseudonocardia acaciae]|uniref:DUF3040 domain-containing protein n=1 Tax=Pseudonocardia acaciae TaxID=551276 RepID=UPI00049003F8|nr:DUF3040 domain-containing protein [Pseudonocardia acaciae]
MLSERERRVLRDIERRISTEDRRFAEAMRRPLPGRSWMRRVYDVTIVVAAALAVLCLALAPVGAFGAGLVAAGLAVGAFYLRRQHFPGRSRG